MWNRCSKLTFPVVISEYMLYFNWRKTDKIKSDAYQLNLVH